ncbi:hypothetical protein BHM03_00005269, partial [Ensete ventricosum]
MRTGLAATPPGGSPASRHRPRCPSAVAARGFRPPVLFSPHGETVSPRGRELEA